MKKPILVTGGCGFVGRHLVKKLINRGDSVLIIDNLFTGLHPDKWFGPEWLRGKDGLFKTYSKQKVTVTYLEADVLQVFLDIVSGKSKIQLPLFSDVFHLASIVGGRLLIDGDPLLVAKDLAIDASLFLWATRFPKNFQRLLYASSSASYPTDLQTKESAVALKEDMIHLSGRVGMPDMTYGWSKLTGEYLSQLAHKKYGIHVACVRPFSGYGEDQDLTYPTPSIALRVARHDEQIEVWGTGEQGRDFVHIDDCIDAMFMILDKVKDGRGINIGTGKLTSFNELIRIMCKIEGHNATIKPLVDKPVGVQSRYADVSILSKEIGWKPAISMEEGMKRVLDGAHARLDVNKKKYSIVTTTINVPVLLEEYVKDIINHKHKCFFVVIGDKKTPIEAKKHCEDLSKKTGMEIVFMDVEDQRKYLRDFPELDEHIQYNCIQRRNIGILYAFQNGADTIITIDDDNFFLTKNFVGNHAVGDIKEIDVISSNNGWINVCGFLEEEHGREFHHRGHPLEFRHHEEKLKTKKKKVKIVVNAGFWLGDPDVDALTRIHYIAKPITAVAYKRDSNFALDKGTWSTFNSQNTSLAREVIPAYFLSPKVGRYDDIWGAYVLKRIADHLDHAISYGHPVVNQERNVHNYWKDLAKESDGMILTHRFVEALKSIKLTQKTYDKCYKEIVSKLPQAFIKAGKPLTPEHQEYFNNYVLGMKVWIKTFERLELMKNKNKK